MGQPLYAVHATTPDRDSRILLVLHATGEDAVDLALARQTAEAHGIAPDIDLSTITDTGSINPS